MTWLVIACSGPGAMAAIRANEVWGWRWFSIAAVVASAAIAIAVWKKRPTKWLFAAVVALAAHPNVWMGARGGDCGRTLSVAAVIGTAVVAGLALVSAWAAARGRPGTREPAA